MSYEVQGEARRGRVAHFREEVFFLNGFWNRKDFANWDSCKWQLDVFQKLPIVPFHLQRFAAEDEGRTEKPSDRLLREERQKGNVAKSSEIVSSTVLLANITVLFFTGLYMIYELTLLFQKSFSLNFADLGSELNSEFLKSLFVNALTSVAKILSPMLIAAVLMGIIANVAQVGFLFTAHPLVINFQRLVPKFERVLPNSKTAFALLRTIFQVTCIGLAAYAILSIEIVSVLQTSDMGLREVLTAYAIVVIEILFAVAILLVFLAIPDFFFQKHVHTEKLKMTLPEAQRESKEQEAHPQLRLRQREHSYALLKDYQQVIKEVPKADVVITNPTHYAVALLFHPETDDAPVVVAKGVNHLAWVIRNLAKKHGVLIEENVQLARTLYRDVEVGREIPETLYRVISIIFQRLYRMRGEK